MEIKTSEAPTHALVPIELWNQRMQYVQSVPTGQIPLAQAAQMMAAMQGVRGCVHRPEEAAVPESDGPGPEEP